MTRSCFTAFFLVLVLGVQLALVSSSKATTASQSRGLASRIVGGSEANRKRFPYNTYLYSKSTGLYSFWNCGGSLIHPDVVLTAASCIVDGSENVTVDVWVNSTTIKYSPHDYYRTAVKLVVHPTYKQPRLLDDIGLVFLDKLVEGVPLVKMNRNAAIPVSINPPSMTAIGLGATALYIDDFWGMVVGADFPKVLMKVPIYPVPMLSCKKAYGSRKVGNGTICAGGDGVKGICELGDRGGPLLMMKQSAQNDVQVGIATGYDCPKKANRPDIFTKVSYYAKWIDRQICKYSKKKPTTCRV